MPTAGPTRRSGSRTALCVAFALSLTAAACSGQADVATARPTSTTTTTTTGVVTAPDAADDSSAASGFPSSWRPQKLRWSECEDDDDLECATLEVPLDWSQPEGATLELALARKPARRDKLGSLFLNPGGPGGSGIDFLADAGIDGMVASRFDLVSWDPRGVGRSSPLRCGSAAKPFLALDPDPDDPAEQQALDDAAAAVAEQCRQLDGNVLAHLGTDDVARDLEAMRLAVGDPKLNYLGFSYGTFIGTRYAAMFPTHIRTMVLDGPLDPTETLTDSLTGQARAFEATIERVFASCTKATRCPVPDLADAYDELRSEVEASPMKGSKRRTLGPAELATAAVYVAYDHSLWRHLGPAVAAALDGDPDEVLDLADGYYDLGSYTVYQGVECLDSPGPRGAAEWAAFASGLEAISPRFGGSIANEMLPCAFWPVPPHDVTGPVAAAGSPPILVLGNTGDPATPYASAERLAAMLEAGRLVTYQGEGHTSYGRSDCVDRIVDDYLVDLTIPQDGARCRR